MYQPLMLERMQVDNDLARARAAVLASRPRPQSRPRRRRGWWPRPRRSALRLAFAGLPVVRTRRGACVDC